MRTVGEILKAARGKKELSFEEIEKETKIRKSFLQALEENEFSKIPGGAIVVKGFIKNYGRFLGLYQDRLLASFRRDFVENEKGQVLPRGYYEPLASSGFSWNPRLTVFVGVTILLLALFVYLGFQAVSFLGKPPLSVSSPLSEERVTTSEVKVRGKTDPDASVLVNGKMAVVEKDGSFEKIIVLFPGENTLRIEAVSRRGKKKEMTRKVFYEALPE